MIEDFNRKALGLRKDLWKEVKALREEDKIACLNIQNYDIEEEK